MAQTYQKKKERIHTSFDYINITRNQPRDAEFHARVANACVMSRHSETPSVVVPLSESSLRAAGLDTREISRQQLSSAASNSTRHSRIEYVRLLMLCIKA